ncbi:MAG: hypothetical protein KAU01_10970, partial [Candidatus Cloacimonetes bacterium]|nr:hypothetical protein [Candidatus Cloacimonadota bacterium]
ILSNWEDYSQVQILAEEIAFYFHEYYWSEDLYPISCSVVKTAYFENILNDISEFSETWSDNASDDIFHLSRQDCIEFNEAWGVYLPADVDIKDFFSNILEHEPPDSLAEFCDRIVANIDNCFIFQKSDYPTGYTSDNVGTGIIWFPDEDTQGYFINRLEEYLQLEFSKTNWQEFLGNSFSKAK